MEERAEEMAKYIDHMKLHNSVDEMDSGTEKVADIDRDKIEKRRSTKLNAFRYNSLLFLLW